MNFLVSVFCGFSVLGLLFGCLVCSFWGVGGGRFPCLCSVLRRLFWLGLYCFCLAAVLGFAAC